MTSPTIRETIARIVDPLAGWNGPGWKHTFDSHEEARQACEASKSTALAKADTILAAIPPDRGEDLQTRILPWMLECFGPVIPFDKQERGDRLLEEVLELLQSGGYDPARVLALRDYVYGRPVGEPSQEVGGVMITLGAYCIAHGLDMAEAGETELARIWTKVEAIRAKQAAKPTGSALPIAVEDAALPHQEGGEQ